MLDPNASAPPPPRKKRIISPIGPPSPPPRPPPVLRAPPRARSGGQHADITHHSYRRSWKMKRALEYQKVADGEKGKWLKDRRIPQTNISRWIEKVPEWEKLTKQELNKSHSKATKGKGLFPEMEKKVYQKFLDRRSCGWRVSYNWLSSQMRIACKKHKPVKYDPNKHKFKTAWVRRFCKRHSISLQKRSNIKCSTVFERKHQVENYDKWLIYHWQDPDNYDEKYFSHETYVLKEIPDEDADADPEEHENEIEMESIPSSETYDS